MHKSSVLSVLSLGCLLVGCETSARPDVTADAGDRREQPDAGPPPTEAAALSLELLPIKTFQFSWSDVANATHYKLLENPDGDSDFFQVGDDIASGEQVIDHIVPLYARVNAQYILQSCNAGGCVDSAAIEVTGSLHEAIGYVKASNTDANDRFGKSLALSADGNTLAVGAHRESSGAIGVNGNQGNGSELAGAVYVFARGQNGWSQQAYVKASNTDLRDEFGFSIALSADGNTMAVSAIQEDSDATGVDGDQNNNDAPGSGAVYVFYRDGTAWDQQAYVKASNTDAVDHFGFSVVLSADGKTMAASARAESSSSTGVGGDQNNNDAPGAGAVYVFYRDGTGWDQQAYVKASNTDAGNNFDLFGQSVALSGDGNTLAVGAEQESSGATGIDGDQDNNDARWAGAVYVFSRNDTAWSQHAYVKASNTDELDRFGCAVALSADGNTLAVGARTEDSNATGIGGDQSNNDSTSPGAAYVFSRSNNAWSQRAYVKASNTDALDHFGYSLALSPDGSTLVVGATGEKSNAIGVAGEQDDNSAARFGATYVFSHSEASWDQQAYVKASNSSPDHEFGYSVAISDDGTLAVGARFEGSSAAGIGGNANDGSAPRAGAVYLY